MSETQGEKKPLSKKQLKKLEKQRKKAEAKEKARLERLRKQEEQQKLEEANDFSKGNYGKREVIQSKEKPGEDELKFTRVEELTNELENATVKIRARVSNKRGKGNMWFVILRQKNFTVQTIASKGNVSKLMLKFIQYNVPVESIVDIEGKVEIPPGAIESCTQQVEIKVDKLFVVSEAENPLPIQLADCQREEPLLIEQRAAIQALKDEEKEFQEKLEQEEDDEKKKEIQNILDEYENKKNAATKYVDLGRDKKLDNRVIDLRATTNQAIFKIQAAVCSLFREYLDERSFVEIHSPKLIGAASESGAAVFSTEFFYGHTAYLAQSPQLYKQMAICSDFERVYEIGPVFRRENSQTHRHMNEFIGLDLEMAFHEHYHEVLETIESLFVFIFDKLNERYAVELEAIQRQYPFEPLKYSNPPLRFKWPEAIALLREKGGQEIGDFEDISTTQEKLLGRIVKEEYDQDFYIIDKFPLNIRPFYTMPDPNDNRYSNSYDIFIRGEEVLSGAQRVHDFELLKEFLSHHDGVNADDLKDYLNSFRYGCPPHAGGGVGLERVVMLFLNLPNIRLTSLFPRTPRRLFP